jgi:SAM-dependent methyltransferase
MTMQTVEHKWAENLHRLRTPGRRRAKQGRASIALERALKTLRPGGVLLDLGCGESGDIAYARKKGIKAFGVDLFPGIKHSIKANATKLPFADGSVDAVINHAMTSLIKPVERPEMYSEIARVLKPNGVYSATFYNLTDGWPVLAYVEGNRVVEAGMHPDGHLYRRCNIKDCLGHDSDLTWKSIVRDCKKLDGNPAFQETAPFFVALVAHGVGVGATAEFCGVPKEVLAPIRTRAIECGILDPETGKMDLPWLTAYAEDQIVDGNIKLILDVMLVRGELERQRNEAGEWTYRAVSPEKWL